MVAMQYDRNLTTKRQPRVRSLCSAKGDANQAKRGEHFSAGVLDRDTKAEGRHFVVVRFELDLDRVRTYKIRVRCVK